jgi:polysaccharide pyruvyl transferase WcaK-like protein
VEVVVFKLSQPYAAEYNLHIADTVPELIDGTDVLIIGGGSLLISRTPSRWRWCRFGLAAKLATRAKEYSLLLDMLSQREIPLYAFSVGGNGIYPEQLTPSYKQRILEISRYVSVRNPEDMELLQRTGTPGDFFPDVVWQTSVFFPIQRQKNSRLRIGLDIYLSNIFKQCAFYLPLIIYAITRIRHDVDFIFIDTTNKSRSPFRALRWPRSGKNTTTYQFYELPHDLEFIASLDLVISTRLHLGVACMSYGIPFLSLFGEKKTEICLKNANLSHLYFSHRRMFDFVSLMLSKEKLFRLIKNFQIPDRGDLIRKSFHHFRQLQNILVKRQSENESFLIGA